MKVLRIVTDFSSDDPNAEAAFYRQLFGLEIVMDGRFIVTLASSGSMRPQLSLMTEGGSGAPVPHLSIEVDDVEGTHRKAVAMGATITYALTDEPWGVRRFFVQDNSGRVLNVLQHVK